MQDQGAATGRWRSRPGPAAGCSTAARSAALFEVRDRIVPEFDAEIDRYASDLIERFRDLMPAAARDASGDGLFVDGGPGGLTGLAGRIAINAAVDPNAGGAVWRLRDGLGAAAPGAEGDGDDAAGAQPTRWWRRATRSASSRRTPGPARRRWRPRSARSSPAARRAATRTAPTWWRGSRRWPSRRPTRSASTATPSSQSLMLVEQAYAANARVLSVIDDLMKLLAGGLMRCA